MKYKKWIMWHCKIHRMRIKVWKMLTVYIKIKEYESKTKKWKMKTAFTAIGGAIGLIGGPVGSILGGAIGLSVSKAIDPLFKKSAN